MKLAVLQFNPRLGAVEHNIQQAQQILDDSEAAIDLLVLPELAFSGYNFLSYDKIKPFLEPTTAGPSTQWAIATSKARKCIVIVGYPEVATFKHPDGHLVTKNYNSTVAVSPDGSILFNYRKSFLYYTDETWAEEGHHSTASGQPFFTGSLGNGLLERVGHGICMDINPYRFEAPWSDYEFATTMLNSGARLVVLSMAWLTRLTAAETERDPMKPDMATVAYWLERFHPFIEKRQHEPIIVLFANRCGSEGTTTGTVEVNNGDRLEVVDRVAYAGSSCVMKFEENTMKLWGRHSGLRKGDVALMGKLEEGLIVVETNHGAGYLFQSAN